MARHTAARIHQLSDDALHLLFEAGRQPPRVPGKITRITIGRSGLWPTDDRQVLRESSLLRMVSVVEAYTDTVAAHLNGTTILPPSPRSDQLLSEFEFYSSQSWRTRLETFSRVHAINLRKLAGWNGVDTAALVRNGIVHGIGAVTPSLRRESGLDKKVQYLDVEVAGGRLHVSDGTLEKVLSETSQFVRALDKQF